MRRILFLLVGTGLAACGGDDAPAAMPDADRGGFEPPILTNAESPVRYPPDLYQEQIEGTVILRLYADANGALVPDSARIAESSNYPSLDSAALDAATRMQFAPARQDGRPVATAFLQPVHFQHPARRNAGQGGR